ncbi:MAG: hypothetical protein JSS90_00930 [Bacteroidetes bacterium]|jgi:hypothetical protein|nr:hypothetical protein [Bacteroidota bacterium]
MKGKSVVSVTILLSSILLMNMGLQAQQNTCGNFADSVRMNALAYKKGWILKSKTNEQENISPSMQPKLNFNTQDCTWTIISKSYKTTRRGKCRHTNGCTVETTQTVIISAENGKLISRKKKKKMIPNYEM